MRSTEVPQEAEDQRTIGSKLSQPHRAALAVQHTEVSKRSHVSSLRWRLRFEHLPVGPIVQIQSDFKPTGQREALAS
jgi:hypothetical protein